MEFTPIGFVCLLAAAVIIARPLNLGLIAFGLFLPLQTASAVNLWNMGGVSLICAHILVGALFLAIVLRPRLFATALRDSLNRPAAVIFFFFVCYAIASAYFMPRLFAGDVMVYSLERPAQGTFGIPLVSLHPSSGNITQSFYLGINLMLFTSIAFILGRRGDLRQTTTFINAITFVHLIFAGLSAIPQVAPAAAILEFVRTANYSILSHHTVAGMKRIIGSYAEASAFGAMSMALFTWNFLRFLQTRGLWHFFATAFLLVCIVVSFSTTAYAVMLLLVISWSLHTVYKLIRSGLSADHLTAFFSSMLGAAILVGFLFFEPLRERAFGLVDILFGQKLQSASGVERSAWNLQALKNFLDTNGFGVGLGSARASSLATVLLSNVGALGALLYAGFLGQSFLRPWRRNIVTAQERGTLYAQRIFIAARGAALALLLSHLIAGGHVDAGLMFFVFAAIATAAYPHKVRVVEKRGFPQWAEAAPKLQFASVQLFGENQGSASRQL